MILISRGFLLELYLRMFETKKIAIRQTEGKKSEFWNITQNKLLSKSLDDMSTAHAFFARHASLAIRIYKEISYLSWPFSCKTIWNTRIIRRPCNDDTNLYPMFCFIGILSYSPTKTKLLWKTTASLGRNKLMQTCWSFVSNVELMKLFEI